MKRRIALLTFLAALTVVLAGCVPALQTNFAAELTPAAEVPAPNLDGATPMGNVTATLNETGDTLTLTGTFSGLTGPATGAHIHGPAPEGTPAGVVFPLVIDSAAEGNISGTWANMTSEQVEQLRQGLYYVNIHTAMNGPGEIRGQIR